MVENWPQIPTGMYLSRSSKGTWAVIQVEKSVFIKPPNEIAAKVHTHSSLNHGAISVSARYKTIDKVSQSSAANFVGCLMISSCDFELKSERFLLL